MAAREALRGRVDGVDGHHAMRALAAHGDHEQLLERSPLYREIVEKGLPEQVFLTTEASASSLGRLRNAAEEKREREREVSGR